MPHRYPHEGTRKLRRDVAKKAWPDQYRTTLKDVLPELFQRTCSAAC